MATLLVAGGITAGVRATDTADGTPATDYSATPQLASCAPSPDNPQLSHLETTQGRAPAADYPTGRAAQGYRCNATEIAHLGDPKDGPSAAVGGYRVHRYTDHATPPHTCAFYDTTLLFPANVYAAGGTDTGVWVLDMSDPAHPVHTDTLRTPAMQSPHESLSLNVERGLLGAVMANPVFYHGQFDLYDVSKDCTHPALQSSLPVGMLGHEGSFAPDGKTYYSASLYGHTLAAIDVSNPLLPHTIWTDAHWNVHGLNLSDDGKTLYFADKGLGYAPSSATFAGSSTPGLTILDVSQIQDRALNPQATVLSHLTWAHVGTPQTAIPITVSETVQVGGVDTTVHHPYLVEIDEFGGTDGVGAARIIDIADPAHPAVVSNMRLAVNNKANQESADQQADPGGSGSLQGYRGHYCNVPRKDDPGIVACSFIASGLRVFDIRDIQHPMEIAYFNKPAAYSNPAQGPQGAYSMSQPAFDVARQQVWYSDGNTGFYVVQIDPAVWSGPTA